VFPLEALLFGKFPFSFPFRSRWSFLILDPLFRRSLFLGFSFGGPTPLDFYPLPRLFLPWVWGSTPPSISFATPFLFILKGKSCGSSPPDLPMVTLFLLLAPPPPGGFSFHPLCRLPFACLLGFPLDLL